MKLAIRQNAERTVTSITKLLSVHSELEYIDSFHEEMTRYYGNRCHIEETIDIESHMFTMYEYNDRDLLKESISIIDYQEF